MNDTGAKQQIVDKIKGNSNILVTVSTNPSVDELSAALGLTLLLNKMNKHATAVFSGAIPPAITFLDPQKTFENTVDSLRDFIIALDKEKADHLRYKVEGDVVKIFITPYRTTISSDDLDFSQGDYNVELVLALGVKNKDYLDGALAAHGRILHDAAVVTMSAGADKSDLGTIDWREENASSLSEMLVSLCEALKSDKGLLDEQIATAFLTGIVAATDRFSNSHTTSRVMTMAAQLMSAGANQQLIASKLEEAHAIGPDAEPKAAETSTAENSDGTTDLSEGESTKLNKKQAAKTEKATKKADDGSLTISHEKEGDVDAVAEQTAAENEEEAAKVAEDELDKRAQEEAAKRQEEAAKVAEANLAKQLGTSAATPSVADLQKDLAEASAEMNEAAEQKPNETTPPPATTAVATDQWHDNDQPPSLGGTLNATTEQAAEDKRRAVEDDRNRTILSHNSGNSYIGDNSVPMFQSPLNAASQKEEDPPMVDPFRESTLPTVNEPAPGYAAPIQPPAPAPTPAPTTTLEEIDKQNRAPHEEAREAVNAAFGAVPFTPTPQPAAIIDALPPQDQAPAAAAPMASLPPMPPLPDFSTLPPMPQAPGGAAAPMGALPPEKLEDMLAPAPAPAAPPQPASNDPAQFKIPGQS